MRRGGAGGRRAAREGLYAQTGARFHAVQGSTSTSTPSSSTGSTGIRMRSRSTVSSAASRPGSPLSPRRHRQVAAPPAVAASLDERGRQPGAPPFDAAWHGLGHPLAPNLRRGRQALHRVRRPLTVRAVVTDAASLPAFSTRCVARATQPSPPDLVAPVQRTTRRAVAAPCPALANRPPLDCAGLSGNASVGTRAARLQPELSDRRSARRELAGWLLRRLVRRRGRRRSRYRFSAPATKCRSSADRRFSRTTSKMIFRRGAGCRSSDERRMRKRLFRTRWLW